VLHLSVVVIYFVDFKGYLQEGVIWFVFYASFLISLILFLRVRENKRGITLTARQWEGAVHKKHGDKSGEHAILF
jgi:hypothetical protein